MRAHLGEDSVIRAHKSISLSTGRPNSIFILSKLLFGGRPLFTLKLLYKGMEEEGKHGKHNLSSTYYKSVFHLGLGHRKSDCLLDNTNLLSPSG